MPEGAPTSESKEKPQKRSSALEAGAVAATLISALNHGPAQALEIDPHISWIAGVQDTIKPSVMKETFEHATVFVQYAGGSTEWVPPTKGGWNGMTVPRKADAQEAIKEGRGREIARMCQIHTHPLATARRAFKLTEGTPPNPPSSLDTYFSRFTQQEYREAGVKKAEVIHAVFDPRGVWYYRSAGTKDYTDPKEVTLQKEIADAQRSSVDPAQHALEEKVWQRAVDTQRAVENFIVDNALAKTIPESKYHSLEETYLRGWEAKIRFVPWDKIIEEPACAGPDYDPKKGAITRGRKTLN
jgi:hypothetical protein